MIPPFLAADLIDASAPKESTYKNTGASAEPTLLPTGLLVAATGKVIEQEDMVATTAAAAKRVRKFIRKSFVFRRLADRQKMYYRGQIYRGYAHILFVRRPLVGIKKFI